MYHILSEWNTFNPSEIRPFLHSHLDRPNKASFFQSHSKFLEKENCGKSRFFLSTFFFQNTFWNRWIAVIKRRKKESIVTSVWSFFCVVILEIIHLINVGLFVCFFVLFFNSTEIYTAQKYWKFEQSSVCFINNHVRRLSLLKHQIDSEFHFRAKKNWNVFIEIQNNNCFFLGNPMHENVGKNHLKLMVNISTDGYSNLCSFI